MGRLNESGALVNLYFLSAPGEFLDAPGGALRDLLRLKIFSRSTVTLPFVNVLAWMTFLTCVWLVQVTLDLSDNGPVFSALDDMMLKLVI